MGKLKEKVFGLIVILALGVIFIPMFFTSNENKNIAKKMPNPETINENNEKQILSKEEKAQGLQGAWAIQLGSFAQPQHAAKFIFRLKNQGFPAYSHHTMIDGKALTIVFVGPILRKEDAKKLMNTLSKFELQGSIVYHTVGR